jgi:hypothetical protein
MNHRDRALLDLAHALHECMNCHRYIPEGLEPAHQNGIAAGKAQSIKSHDHRHCAICHVCHAWYDSGSGLDPTGRFEGNRAGKAEMWSHAFFSTLDAYWQRNWLVVNPKGKPS